MDLCYPIFLLPVCSLGWYIIRSSTVLCGVMVVIIYQVVELALWSRLNHPNIVRCYGVLIDIDIDVAAAMSKHIILMYL